MGEKSKRPLMVKRVFSVDDDPNEVQQDIRCLEELQDGVKIVVHSNNSNNNILDNANADDVLDSVRSFSTPDLMGSMKLTPRVSSNNGTPSNNVNNKLKSGAASPRFIIHDHPRRDVYLEEVIPQPSNTTQLDKRNSNNTIDGQLDLENLDNDLNNFVIDENEQDNASRGAPSRATSIESYTLRERQDAINETHPFGIRIWKPALYKKKRSVEKAAAEDIHETKLKKITWGVKLTNLLWVLICGIGLYILLTIAAGVVLIAGLFTESGWEYAKLLYNIAKYLLYPFGKVVYMIQEEQYLEEDRGEGISTHQFYNWVTTYKSRLFFHGSQNGASPSGFMGNAGHHASYGSIQKVSDNQQQQKQQQEQQDSSTPDITERIESTSYTQLPYNQNSDDHDSEAQNISTAQRRLFGRGKWTWGRIVFYAVFYSLLQPLVLILSLLTWLIVFTIPMSNILWNLMYHCRRHPLALRFKSIKNSSNQIMEAKDDKNILLCTFRCAGWHYYKFTVDGTNVIVVNLIAMVFFTIFDFYLFKEWLNLDFWFTNETTVFILCLASIIPLAFYIGQAVASISAQTSMGLGAVINAFFSTIVEIFLYCVALQQEKGLLVEGSMIGSILGAVLLLPGLSMCGGALKRKTQRYNPRSAGVSSALLIFSMIVMFVPTMLYMIYGGYDVVCDDTDDTLELGIYSIIKAVTTTKCQFSHPPLTFDKMYEFVIEPMSIACALVLFLAYAIGLWFTLRTHAATIWQVPISDPPKEHIVLEPNQLDSITNLQENVQDRHEQMGGHDAPNWSRSKSTMILLLATLLYAIIAEILVSCVDSVLENIPSLNPKFLGLTIFALVPNTTEFLNAISFAIHGNIALSMEIGTAYALQVCLLQIPALVLFSVVYIIGVDKTLISIRDQMFPLVFPTWDLIATMTSIFLFTYLYAEGKSNYFKGSVLILLYIIVIMGFYYQGVMAGWGIQ